jgi:putative two-component system response regulator
MFFSCSGFKFEKEKYNMLDFSKFGNISILSVEDDEFNQELATAIFEEFENITIFKAEDGKEAIDILENNHLDIVLLDLLMPNIDGIEVLKYIKSTDNLKNIPIIIVTSKEDEKKETYKLGADDFISKPYNPEELKLRVYNHLRLSKFNTLFSSLEHITGSDDVSSDDYKECIREILELAEGSQKRLLLKLGKLTHATSGYSGDGSVRVAEYAKLLGTLYGLSSKDVENLYYSMFIYDIGMLRISADDISTKEYRMHPEYGVEILNDLKETSLIKMAKDVTLYHHENFDGDGFPKGLKENEIPIYARIASIADKFDELTSIRPYNKKKVNSTEAMEYIKRDSGSVFDPKLVELFVENFTKFREIKNRYDDK